jgi:sporulation protein YlmC with PRC-barrel domain
MKRITSTVGAIALLGCAWPALAQTDKETKPKDKAPSQAHVTPAAGKDVCFLHKSGDVVGADVRNAQDENLGEISELVIDPETGNIEYAVLSFGGFMGMGDKLFALPWGVLQPVHKAEADAKYFLLSVDKERLKTSPGFPKSNWPDMSSPEWSKSIRDFYKEDMTPSGASKAIDASKRYNLVKATDLKGCDVDTSDGKDAGEISELAVDVNAGRVAYFILASGGFLGFGKDKYVIPWQAATVTVGEDKDLICKLHVPQAKFEKAPDYVESDWKKMSDPVFVREVYTFYGTPVYWKDAPMEAGSHRAGEDRNP